MLTKDVVNLFEINKTFYILPLLSMNILTLLLDCSIIFLLTFFTIAMLLSGRAELHVPALISIDATPGHKNCSDFQVTKILER